MSLSTALLIAEILSKATPEVVEIILLLKRKDGSISVIPVLDEADEKFADNIKQIKKWKKDHSTSE